MCQPLGSLCHNQPLWEALLEHLKIGTDCRALDNGLSLFKYLIKKLIGTSDNFNTLLNVLCNILLQQPVVEMNDADGVGAELKALGKKSNDVLPIWPLPFLACPSEPGIHSGIRP